MKRLVIYMTYTVAQAAQRTGMSVHTLRYYSKEGLLPLVERDSAGNRRFRERDFEWLQLISCLKKTGLPLKQIRDFVNYTIEGDSTIDVRLEIIKAQKLALEQQMQELKECMKMLEHKVWYYETAREAGTTAIHDKKENMAV